MISADQLASMQTQLEASLHQTCTRRRWPDVADGYGNLVRDTANPVDVVYPCRLVPAPGNESTVDRDVQTSEASVLLPHDADVAGGDALVIDAAVWEVLGPAVTQSWATHLRVLVRRTVAQ